MKHIILLFACFCIAFSVNVFAQNVAGSVEIGVYSAYQFTHFSGGYIELDSSKYIDDVYSTYGYTIGGMVELHISQTVALIGMLRYEELHGLKSRYTSETSRKANGTEQTLHFSNDLEVRAPQIMTTLLGKLTIPETKLSVVVGGSVGVLVFDKEEQRTVNLFDPQNPYQFFPLIVDSLHAIKFVKEYKPHYLDETRSTIIYYTGPIYQRKSLQLGLTAGLQYDLPIYTLDEAAQKFVTLTPSVLFNYNLTTYSDYEKLRAWNVNAGFVLKVGL